MELRERVDRARERIGAAQKRSGRSGPVELVAVTKTHPPEAVRAVLAAGLTSAAENRVQELESKVEALGRDAVRWHLIGRLQRNKARRALPLFDLLHSLDSVALAEDLSRLAMERGDPVRALVQVNVAGEATKGGFPPADVPEAVERMYTLPGLELCGMMAMAPFTDEAAVQRRVFARARALAEDTARQVPAFRPIHLSMGMSNDFEVAVEEGSTLVRLGTVLFGERDP